MPWKFTTVATPTTANQAYGVNTHHIKEVEKTIYNCQSPEVKVGNAIEAKQNEDFVTMTNTTVDRNQP